jgi:hypothetical protein
MLQAYRTGLGPPGVPSLAISPRRVAGAARNLGLLRARIRQGALGGNRRQEIDHIIAKHAVVRQRVDNEWTSLFHIEPAAATVSRFRPSGAWQHIEATQ